MSIHTPDCGCSEDQSFVPSMLADDTLKASAWVSGLTENDTVAWSYEVLEGSPEIKIESQGKHAATIQPTNGKGGLIKVIANEDNGECIYEGVMALCDADSGSDRDDGTCSAHGSGSAGNQNGIQFKAFTGDYDHDYAAGYIALMWEGAPTADLTLPETLPFEARASGAEVLWATNSALRQVSVPQGLVDVIITDADKYELKFYYDDDDSIRADVPRREIVKIKNNEVSRIYRKYTTTSTEIQLEEQVCPDPDLAWDNSANITTITIWHQANDDHGRLKEITHPDGTMSFYTYSESASDLTTTLKTGEPNAAESAVRACLKNP